MTATCRREVGRPRHRVNVRWVTPRGVETASTSYCCSNASRPSHSRTPRPSRIGTCTTMAVLVSPGVRYEPSYREAMAEFVAEGRAQELRSLPQRATFTSFVAELH